MKRVILTNSELLVQVFEHLGLTQPGDYATDHLTKEEARDCHVIGTDVPYDIAASAAYVTIVTINLPYEKRFQEQPVNVLLAAVDSIDTYIVRKENP